MPRNGSLGHGSIDTLVKQPVDDNFMNPLKTSLKLFSFTVVAETIRYIPPTVPGSLDETSISSYFVHAAALLAAMAAGYHLRDAVEEGLGEEIRNFKRAIAKNFMDEDQLSPYTP